MSNDRYNLDQIREFWTQQAQEHGEAPAASWSDVSVIEMEIAEILRRLNDGERVLDIGCANGFSTFQFALQKRLDILGMDYIPEMIQSAHERLATLKSKLVGSLRFAVGDITKIDQPDNAYDKVVVIRVVINLGDWEHQQQALREVTRVLKPGGTLLLSEATLQGWRRLNEFRCEWGMADIPMPPFNQYLDQEQVCRAVEKDLELVEIVNFASTYYVGSRVLKPLLIQALGLKIDAADPGMNWNRWFAQMPAVGDYGTQKLFVFRKR